MQIEPFRLERYYAAQEFKARFMLSSSDAESMSLDELLELEPATRDSLGSLRLGYSDSAGLPETRQEVAKTYRSIAPDEVLLHSGAQEPIFNLMNATLAAGDHVVVHTPSYQSFRSVPKAIGCEVTPWQARPELGWRLDLDELPRLLRPNTKLVLINCPHNPTGASLTVEEQAELVRILRERGIALLSDEVYRGMEFAPHQTLPAACDLYERAVSLGVLSKVYGLAGLRLGWIATRDRELYAKVAAYKDYTTICNPALTETLGAVALRNRDRIIARNRSIAAGNLLLLDRFFADEVDRFAWTRPVGGTMAFPRRTDGVDMAAFAARLLETKSVMLVAGPYFDAPADCFRLGFGRKGFAEAFDLFVDFLE